MPSVFLLYHLGHEPDDGEDEPDEMLLGVFSSEETALAWKADAVERPGFRDWPDRFQVVEHVIDQREWPDGFETVGGTEPAEPILIPLPTAAAQSLLEALQRWAHAGSRAPAREYRLVDGDNDEITFAIRDEP